MDESKAGSCLWITNRRGFEYWPTPSEEAKYLVDSSRFKKRSEFKAPPVKIPVNFEKMCVFQIHLCFSFQGHPFPLLLVGKCDSI